MFFIIKPWYHMLCDVEVLATQNPINLYSHVISLPDLGQDRDYLWHMSWYFCIQ